MKAYHLLTVTHKSVPLAQLGQYYISRTPQGEEASGEREERLGALARAFGFGEIAYLETCNRVLYLFTDAAERDEDFVPAFFQFVNPHLPEDRLYRTRDVVAHYRGQDAVRHLHEVAASLDSLVIGEREILGQLKASFERCRLAGLVGDELRLLFKYVFPAAKKVYSGTRIAEKPVSVVSLAARELKAAGLPERPRVALVGAGQTMRLMGKFLAPLDKGAVTVYNRSVENAAALARELGGRALPLEDLPRHEGGCDVLITCTGAHDALITPAVHEALGSPRWIVDLAVPADVSDAVAGLAGVRYVGMDQLRGAAERNLAFRQRELVKARALVEGFVDEFARAWRRRRLERAMASVPAEVRALRRRATEQVFDRELAALDPEARATLDKVLDYLERKYTALPIKAAREALIEGEEGTAPACPLRKVP